MDAREATKSSSVELERISLEFGKIRDIPDKDAVRLVEHLQSKKITESTEVDRKYPPIS